MTNTFIKNFKVVTLTKHNWLGLPFLLISTFTSSNVVLSKAEQQDKNSGFEGFVMVGVGNLKISSNTFEYVIDKSGLVFD